MGIDYSGNYGIGYKVIESDKIPEHDIENGLSEYIFDNLGQEYEYFEVGYETYNDKPNDIYIVLKNPFENGLDLASKKAKLDKEIKRLKLLPDSKFGSFGGLHAC